MTLSWTELRPNRAYLAPRSRAVDVSFVDGGWGRFEFADLRTSAAQ